MFYSLIIILTVVAVDYDEDIVTHCMLIMFILFLLQPSQHWLI